MSATVNSLRFGQTGSLKLLAASLAGLLLAGCQSGPNPYTYNYAEKNSMDLCVVQDPSNSATELLQLKNALKEKGFSVREVRVASLCHTCLRLKAEGASKLQIDRAELSLEQDRGIKHRVDWNRKDDARLNAQFVDSSAAIRDLVDRMFPEPMPWSAR